MQDCAGSVAKNRLLQNYLIHFQWDGWFGYVMLSCKSLQPVLIERLRTNMYCELFRSNDVIMVLFLKL